MTAIAEQPDIKTLAGSLADPVGFSSLLRWQGKPLSLYSYQQDFLRQTDFLRGKCCLVKGRQVGGSLLISIGICFYAFAYSDLRIIIVSKTHEQAGFVDSYVRRFFDTSPILADAVDRKKTTKDTLYLRNGTIVYHRTAGNKGDNLRGITCEGRGFLVFDESSSIPSDAIENLYPVAFGAGIIHVSTPKSPSGAFYKATRDPDFKVWKIPCSRCPRIPASELARLKRIFSPSKYRQEVLAEFSQGEDAVFDADAVERAIDDSLPLWSPESRFRGEPGRNYVYSLDVSKVGCDLWVLMIGEYDRENNFLSVVAYHPFAGTQHLDSGLNATLVDNPDLIIRTIREYRQTFACTKMFVDATSNEYFAHVLENHHLFPVEKVTWSTAKKERLIEHLATVFRADRIAIPNDDSCISQLLSFAYDLKKMQDQSDKRIYLAGEDDYVAALAMLATVVSDEQFEWSDFIEVW